MIPFERKMLRILGASRRDLALLVQGELRANPLRIDDMRARPMLRDPQAKDIAEHYLARGQWLIRSLAMRRTLLMRLVDWLVAEKRDAFEKGATFVDGADWRDASRELGIDLEA